MKYSFARHKTAFAVTILLVCAPLSIATTTLIQTGFETTDTPAYHTGQLAGQNGWTGDTRPYVETTTVFNGSQAVEFDNPGSGQGFTNYNLPAVAGVVTLEDHFMQGTTGTSSVWDALDVAGLGHFVQFFVGSGFAYVQVDSTATTSPVSDAPGSWNDYKLVFDFGAGTVTGYLNGVSIGALSLPSGFTALQGVSIGVNNVSTGTDSGYWDDLSVTTSLDPLTISKSFSPNPVVAGTPTTLTFTVGNPNTSAATSVAFTDSLPSGMNITTGPTASSGCGTPSTTINTTSLSIANASLASSGTCTVSIGVAASAPGTYNNTTSTITATGFPPGAAATATLTAVTALTLSKAFTPSSILPGGTSSLSFTLTNPNTVNATAIAFADMLPSGVVVASTPAFTSNCAGTTTPNIVPTGLSVALASLAAGATCTMSLNVSAANPGTYDNTTSTITANVLPAGAAASATLTVLSPPGFTKSFGTGKLAVGNTTSLTFTITNTDSVAITGLAFSDTLPAGLVVATPNALSNGCGGTVTATQGSGSISLSGGTVGAPVGTKCTIVVNVTGTVDGAKNNTTSSLTSANAPAANPATASITVAVPPSLSKSFGETAIPPGGSTTLTFKLSNLNTTQTLTGLAFTDSLPAGLVVSTPNGLTGSCGGGPISAVAGATTIGLSGATLAAGASCTFAINVTASLPGELGLLQNVTSAVTSNEAIPGAAATASLFVGDAYQLRYAANLETGDSVINITNTGAAGAGLSSGTSAAVTGAICVNVYAFDPSEEVVACCSCPVTPNGLVSLSAQQDILSNTFRSGALPASLVIKLVATAPVGGSCVNSAAGVGTAALSPGLAAWGTTLHSNSGSGGYAVTETGFSPSALSAGEVARLSYTCTAVQNQGSGNGVCNSCRLGGLGAVHQ